MRRVRWHSEEEQDLSEHSISVSPFLQGLHSSSAPVTIACFDDNMAESWDRFARAHPSGSFFHQVGWKKVMEKTYGYRPCYFYAHRAGEITGIAPVFLTSSWIAGKCLISLPFAVYGGICASDAESEQALLGHVERLAADWNVQYLELRNRRSTPLRGYHRNERYATFTLPLSDEKSMYDALPKDARYMIRKGERAGLKTKRGFDQLDTFYRLMTINLRRLGTPAFPKSLFRNLIREYPGQVDLTVVYSGDQPMAAGMSFFFRDWMQPYYVGSLSEAKTVAANNFLWWEMIKFGSQCGLRTFDFGRSKKGSGNYTFKAKWNPNIETLDYQIRLVRRTDPPNFSPMNSKFSLAMDLWKKAPLGLTAAIGPHLVKWFP